MGSKIVHLDYETRSTQDLRKVGLDVYSRHHTTDVLCAAYAFDDESIKLWLLGDAPPTDLLEHISAGGQVWAHNAPFEIAICNNVAKRYGWPSIRPEQAVCTMAMAYAMGLPGSLDGCAAALGVTERKDLVGGRLMLQLSKPREIKEDGTIVWWDGEERLNKLYDYCRQDVVVERAVGKRMPRLSSYERRVWLLDQKINNRGIMVDVKAVTRAIALVEKEKDRLDKEIRLASDNQIATCTAVQQIKSYLEFFGISGETLDKAAVTEYLGDEKTDPTAKRILSLRAEAGKAATSKFEPMVTSVSADGRLRGCFQYSGANTRRWTGRRVQLHNLKRPSLKHDIIESMIESISKGLSAEELTLYYGPPMHFLGDCTRSFLTAGPGNELGVADFSAIEARVLAWLTNEEATLEVFRNGKDAYKQAAASIFGCKPEEVTDQQRQIGKVAVLALGYGGGVGAFQTMAGAYGVKMAPAYDFLWKSANPNQRLTAEKTWESNKENYEEITREEFLASEMTKIFWREANRNIVSYWTALEDAAINACLHPGEFFGPGPNLPRVLYKKAGSFLWCQLPGGGVICYPYPEVKNDVKTPWGSTKTGLTYMAEDGQSHKWLRFTTYGGSLAENITQAVSRDLLADAMLRLDAKGYDIIAHVHDEIICEAPSGKLKLENMIETMVENPSWAKNLPIAASGFVSKRYRK